MLWTSPEGNRLGRPGLDRRAVALANQLDGGRVGERAGDAGTRRSPRGARPRRRACGWCRSRRSGRRASSPGTRLSTAFGRGRRGRQDRHRLGRLRLAPVRRSPRERPGDGADRHARGERGVGARADLDGQVVAAAVAAAEDDLGEPASPEPVSLIALPPCARDFDAQRRTQVTLATLGMATKTPPPPRGGAWAAAAGASSAQNRRRARRRNGPRQRGFLALRLASLFLRPTGLADGLALTRATTKAVGGFAPRTVRPSERFPRSPVTADRRPGFGWLCDRAALYTAGCSTDLDALHSSGRPPRGGLLCNEDVRGDTRLARAQLARRRRDRQDARPARDPDRRHPARQAQARVHAARGRGRLRDRGQRRAHLRDRQQARRRSATTATRATRAGCAAARSRRCWSGARRRSSGWP